MSPEHKDKIWLKNKVSHFAFNFIFVSWNILWRVALGCSGFLGLWLKLQCSGLRKANWTCTWLCRVTWQITYAISVKVMRNMCILPKLLKTHIIKSSLQKMLVNLNIQELGTAQFIAKKSPPKNMGKTILITKINIYAYIPIYLWKHLINIFSPIYIL